MVASNIPLLWGFRVSRGSGLGVSPNKVSGLVFCFWCCLSCIQGK